MLPPYGQMARIYTEELDALPRYPAAWKPNLSEAERQTAWEAWVDESARLIRDALWLDWDHAAGAWSGDTTGMMELTRADMLLLREIETDEMLLKQPISPVAAASIPTHLQYFLDEDGTKVGDRYFFYDVTLPAERLAAFIPDLRKAVKEQAGSVDLHFKQASQRPRPYQLSAILGQPIRLELARSSMTPALPSGHSFQGSIVTAGVYAAWLAAGFAPTSDQLAALGEYGMDLGDRRVFAGVHYPSDNLASWILALRLTREIHTDPRISAFLGESILQRSYVFRKLKSAPQPQFAQAVELVTALAQPAPDPIRQS